MTLQAQETRKPESGDPGAGCGSIPRPQAYHDDHAKTIEDMLWTFHYMLEDMRKQVNRWRNTARRLKACADALDPSHPDAAEYRAKVRAFRDCANDLAIVVRRWETNLNFAPWWRDWNQEEERADADAAI